MTTYSTQSIPDYPRAGQASIELDILADVDSLGSYEWDRFVVLRDPTTGNLYTLSGSGCSCNYLYEGVRTLDDLDGPYTFHHAAAKAQEWERAEDEGEWTAERRKGLGASVVEALMRAERDGAR